LDAASGLTTIKGENSFVLSVAETKGIVPSVITREKAHAVKKNGFPEVFESKESLDSIDSPGWWGSRSQTCDLSSTPPGR